MTSRSDMVTLTHKRALLIRDATECPVCGAPAGRACVAREGSQLVADPLRVHGSRVDRAWFVRAPRGGKVRHRW